MESKARKSPAQAEQRLEGETHKTQINRVALTNSSKHSAK